MQRAACDTTTREIFAGASYLYLPLPFRGEIATQIGLRARQPSLRTRRLDSRDLSKSAATAARGAGGWGGGGERNASVPRRDATRLARDTAASLTPPPPLPPLPTAICLSRRDNLKVEKLLVRAGANQKSRELRRSN